MSAKISQYSRGILDPKSFSGRGTIIEYVVLEAMGDCVKQKFNYKYDLFSKRLGEVNVKSSLLKSTNNTQYWEFVINPNGYVPEYYVCVALDQYYGRLLHVWEIPGNSNVVHKNGIMIRNSINVFEKFNEYEVDASKYNEIYQNIDITKYPEFNRLDDDETSLSYLNYGWGQEAIITYFNRETGEVYTEKESVEKGKNSLKLDGNCYPVYNYHNIYCGYIEDGEFVDIGDERLQSFIKHALGNHIDSIDTPPIDDHITPLIIQTIKNNPLNHKYVLLCLAHVALKTKLPIQRRIVKGCCVNLAKRYGIEFLDMRSVNMVISSLSEQGVIETTKTNVRRIGNEECTIQDIIDEIYQDPHFAKFKA